MKKLIFILLLFSFSYADHNFITGLGISYDKNIDRYPQLNTILGYLNTFSFQHALKITAEIKSSFLELKYPNISVPASFYYRYFCVTHQLTFYKLNEDLLYKQSTGLGFMFEPDARLYHGKIMFDHKFKTVHFDLNIMWII